jgi:hypothetical protein
LATKLLTKDEARRIAANIAKAAGVAQKIKGGQRSKPKAYGPIKTTCWLKLSKWPVPVVAALPLSPQNSLTDIA